MHHHVKFALTVVAVACLGATSFADNKPEKTDTEANVEQQTEQTDKGDQKRLNRIWKTQEVVEGFEAVEMFEAIDNGDIEVIIKTKSSANSNMMFTNKSNRPLAIRVPPAFAAVPVMGQALGGGGGGLGGGGGGFGGGGGGFGGGGGNQGVGGGGGFGGGGGGFGGGGGGLGGGGGGRGGGIFNIPPGRVGKININTVCLEYGKADPRPRMEYKVVPIEELTTDPKVHEMIRMLANDEVTQNVAQAAVWNAANGLSWEFMLTKNRIERMDGYYERYFSPNELMMAHGVVEIASQRVAALGNSEPSEYKSSGELIDAEQADKQ
jgi:hypothetical protein